MSSEKPKPLNENTLAQYFFREGDTFETSQVSKDEILATKAARGFFEVYFTVENNEQQKLPREFIRDCYHAVVPHKYVNNASWFGKQLKAFILAHLPPETKEVYSQGSRNIVKRKGNKDYYLFIKIREYDMPRDGKHVENLSKATDHSTFGFQNGGRGSEIENVWLEQERNEENSPLNAIFPEAVDYFEDGCWNLELEAPGVKFGRNLTPGDPELKAHKSVNDPKGPMVKVVYKKRKTKKSHNYNELKSEASFERWFKIPRRVNTAANLGFSSKDGVARFFLPVHQLERANSEDDVFYPNQVPADPVDPQN